MVTTLTSTADLSARLGATGYLADESLATIVYLALQMERPLLLEGEPGVGKTEVAEALARRARPPLVRLQCYEGIDATQALYDWDYPRQILHLRALEAAGDVVDVEKAESRCSTSGSCSRGRCCGRCAEAPRGAARRRDRPGRRRVRGVPARGALRLTR